MDMVRPSASATIEAFDCDPGRPWVTTTTVWSWSANGAGCVRATKSRVLSAAESLAVSLSEPTLMILHDRG